LILLASLLGLGAGDASSRGQAEPDARAPVDFIRFNDAVYLSSAYIAQDGQAVDYRPLDADDLGPVVGQVVSDRIDPADESAYPNEPCYWHSVDGTAPRLAPDDDIHAVRSYATTFRLAARHDGEIVLYQVWCNDQAEVGADLFDIFERVERIEVAGDLSEQSGWAVIAEPATRDALVGMLLSGAFVPEEFASTAPVTHQLIISLDDGTNFRASVAPGEFLWGLGVIQVPDAFGTALEEAWTGYLTAATAG
jgi:hypothetical protein